jgi:hypothetical protein
LVHTFTPLARTIAGLRRSIGRGVMAGSGVWLHTLDALGQDDGLIRERTACLIAGWLASLVLQVDQVAAFPGRRDPVLDGGAFQVQVYNQLVNLHALALVEFDDGLDCFPGNRADSLADGVGDQVGYQGAHRQVVGFGGDDAALLVGGAVELVQDRVRLDQAQQCPEVAAQPYRDGRDVLGQPCGVGDDDVLVPGGYPPVNVLNRGDSQPR